MPQRVNKIASEIYSSDRLNETPYSIANEIENKRSAIFVHPSPTGAQSTYGFAESVQNGAAVSDLNSSSGLVAQKSNSRLFDIVNRVIPESVAAILAWQETFVEGVFGTSLSLKLDSHAPPSIDDAWQRYSELSAPKKLGLSVGFFQRNSVTVLGPKYRYTKKVNQISTPQPLKTRFLEIPLSADLSEDVLWQCNESCHPPELEFGFSKRYMELVSGPEISRMNRASASMTMKPLGLRTLHFEPNMYALELPVEFQTRFVELVVNARGRRFSNEFRSIWQLKSLELRLVTQVSEFK